MRDSEKCFNTMTQNEDEFFHSSSLRVKYSYVSESTNNSFMDRNKYLFRDELN